MRVRDEVALVAGDRAESRRAESLAPRFECCTRSIFGRVGNLHALTRDGETGLHRERLPCTTPAGDAEQVRFSETPLDRLGGGKVEADRPARSGEIQRLPSPKRPSRGVVSAGSGSQLSAPPST